MSIFVSTGDIKDPYTVIDAIFALDASTQGFLSGADPGKAFAGVKNQLITTCKKLGGDAVINCQFEYRNALAGGLLGKKQSIEIFAYGTAVKLVKK